MILTSLKKVRNDVQLIFDDGSVIYLDYRTVCDFALRKGDIIEEQRVKSIILHNKLQKCKDSALIFLARRLHSRYELRSKLIRKKIEREIIESVLSELEEKKYLNDIQFVELFIKEKSGIKKIGVNKIRMHLQKRGIPKSLIDSFLNLHDPDLEINSAMEIGMNKLKQLQSRSFDSRKNRIKLSSFLLSRGFSFETIHIVTSRILGENINYSEEELD